MCVFYKILRGGLIGGQASLGFCAGEGHQTACIAELISVAIAIETGQPPVDTRRQVWLVDSKGLVTRQRGDSSILEEYKLPFCHDGPECPGLLSAIKAVGADVLVGCSNVTSPPFAFDQQVKLIMTSSSPHFVLAGDRHI